MGKGFVIMRTKMEAIVKSNLRTLALRTRARRALTQEQMAEALSMSVRSYIDIEAGVSMCGTLTALLLLMEQEAPASLLSELRGQLRSLYEEVAV